MKKHPSLQEPEVHGQCFGLDIEHRNDAGALLRIVIEDDENWHRKDVYFDEFWLDDLIYVCNKAKKVLGKT